MALSCGFFNSQAHDRKYDAVQFSQIFDGLIKDGVYATVGKALVVKASTTDQTEVIVQPGRAWFNHTWTLNDADEPVTSPLPDPMLDRIDALVLDVNTDVSVRDNTLVWVSGEPAAENPEKPSLTHTDTHNQYPLCYVYRKAGENNILQENIENTVGTELCPFVTGIIETVEISELIAQWKSQFNNWMYNEKVDFVTWFEDLQVILDGDVAAKLASRILTIENELTANDKRIYMDYKDYVLTKDTEVKTGKTYYTYNSTSDTYEEVIEPTGSPAAQLWYEFIGRYGINTDPARGADTFIPFRRPATEIFKYPSGDKGGLTDMGEDHEYRYVDATEVYVQGWTDGAAEEGHTPAKGIEYIFHHHTISDKNLDSSSEAPGIYSDGYLSDVNAGCYTKPMYNNYWSTPGHKVACSASITKYVATWSRDGMHDWYEWACSAGHSGVGTNPYHETTVGGSSGRSWSPTPGKYNQIKYACTCGKKDCQKIKEILDFT